MALEIVGKLHKIYPTEKKTETFQTREFVVALESGNYVEYAKFQLTQDRCNLIESYSEGDTLKVHFDLRGKEWQGKYFTNLNAWKLEKNAGAAASTAAPTASVSAPAKATASFPSPEDEPVISDDLPF